MFKNLLPVAQGSVGLGHAIAYYCTVGNVAVPLNDNQDYDLIVEIKGNLRKVQVKTTRQKLHGNYVVQLKSVRSNKKVNVIKGFDNSSSDLLFILTEEGQCYSIPSGEVTAKSSLALGLTWSKYLV